MFQLIVKQARCHKFVNENTSEFYSESKIQS